VEPAWASVGGPYAGRRFQALEVFFIDDALLFSRRLGVLGHKLFPMINPNPSVLEILNVDDLADPFERHRIPVVFIRDARVGRHFPRMPVHFLERHRVERFEPFPNQAFTRRLLGRPVHPNIGDRVQPIANLSVQIVQTGEGFDTWPEVFADIADAVFHLALRPRPVGTATLQQKPVMCRKTGKPFIPDGVSAFVKVRDHGFHIVVQNDFRTTAEVFERPQMTAHERVEFFILREFDVHHAGVA